MRLMDPKEEARSIGVLVIERAALKQELAILGWYIRESGAALGEIARLCQESAPGKIEECRDKAKALPESASLVAALERHIACFDRISDIGRVLKEYGC